MTPERRGRFLQWAAGTRRRSLPVAALLRSTGRLLPDKPPPRDPVFVLGTPRSGTTMLVDLLDRSPELASLRLGSQFLWEMFHPIERRGWDSHVVSPESITERERHVVNWVIDRVAGDLRYLDKFPRNCLRGEYLHAMFPDAYFVAIARDGRAVVSSLITGWRASGRFGPGIRLPVPLSIDGYEGDVWRFLLPPGWRDYVRGHTLSEVCALQWVAGTEAMLQARQRIKTDRWIDVRYEDLVADPVGGASRLLRELALPRDQEVLSWARELDRNVSRTAVTAPRHDKWREEHPEEVRSILGMIAPTMRAAGYDPEP